MRRSASEIINNLENRVAHLEKKLSSGTVSLNEGMDFILLKETKGRSQTMRGRDYGVFHLLPGTILRVDKIRYDRGGYGGMELVLGIVSLNAGSINEVEDKIFTSVMWVNGRGGGEYILDGTEGNRKNIKVL